MARLCYWLMTALLLTSACGTTGEGAAAATDDISARAQGFWLLESYTINDERHEVEVGVNTASEAWIEIGEAIQGKMGCNTTGREISRWTDDTITISGGHNTSMDCGWQDERLMEVEHLLQGMMANEPIQIEVDGDTMLWTREDTQLVFRSTPVSPTTTVAPYHAILGTWRLEAIHTPDDYLDVGIGINTAEHPWVEIDTAAISGNSGCNGFGTAGEYEFDGEWLTLPDVYSTAMGCVGDDGSDLMQIEAIFEELFWADPPRIHVRSDGETMLWRNGTYELRFYRGTPPAPAPPEPLQTVGRLSCAPGYMVEQYIDDSTRETEQILRDEVPEVVRTEQDLEFAPPAPDGWFWLGYDSDDNLIAFIARGDIEPPRYQLWTCSDDPAPTR